MTQPKALSCHCGKVHIEVEGTPIISAECCCNSCGEASVRLEALPGAPHIREPNGATRYVLYRKDRVRIVEGAENLAGFRLKPGSKTRRVVAACCKTPLFLEFSGGHWLSLYGTLWPAGTLPPLEIRTMVADLAVGTVLPADVPNARTQNFKFMLRLLGAWIAMGFRSPKVAVPGVIDA